MFNISPFPLTDKRLLFLQPFGASVVSAFFLFKSPPSLLHHSSWPFDLCSILPLEVKVGGGGPDCSTLAYTLTKREEGVLCPTMMCNAPMSRLTDDCLEIKHDLNSKKAVAEIAGLVARPLENVLVLSMAKERRVSMFRQKYVVFVMRGSWLCI